MTDHGPLSGRTIVVTRPRAQAAPLAEAIAAAGGKPLIFPLLDISPANDLQPLAETVARLADYSLAVFISPNAVEYTLPAILAHGTWPKQLKPVAIGQGTVKALAVHSISGCVAPSERFDSEALLALPELAADKVRDKRIAIFRGDGGRELLADTLRERGAMVDCITCYRRAGPAAGVGPLISAWRGVDEGPIMELPKVCAIFAICSIAKAVPFCKKHRFSSRMPALPKMHGLWG